MQNFSPTAFTLITIPVDNLSTTRYSGNIPSHVYFYPEGGHLLSGSLQNVAFEVKDENGLPVQTTASLCKGSSDTVYSNLVTDSYGIGSFSFIPDSSSLLYPDRVTSFSLSVCNLSTCVAIKSEQGTNLL